jgi:hypothetical protein
MTSKVYFPQQRLLRQSSRAAADLGLLWRPPADFDEALSRLRAPLAAQVGMPEATRLIAAFMGECDRLTLRALQPRPVGRPYTARQRADDEAFLTRWELWRKVSEDKTKRAFGRHLYEHDLASSTDAAVKKLDRILKTRRGKTGQ